MSRFYLTVRRPVGDVHLLLRYTLCPLGRERFRVLARETEIINRITPNTSLRVLLYFGVGSREQGISFLVVTTDRKLVLTEQEYDRIKQQAVKLAN